MATESEQGTPVDPIKDGVRSSVLITEFDKHLKKAGGHIGRNVVEITIKMKTIVRKPLMIKIFTPPFLVYGFIYFGRSYRSIVVYVLVYEIVVSSNSSCSFTFTFGLIPML